MDIEYTVLPEWEALERFDDDLNEAYGEVTVCGMQYETARVLKLIDPVAYRCAFLDFLDAECLELEGEE